MANRVALSAQASQDQQNNSIKHPENCIFTLFTSDCMFTLSGARQSLWKLNYARSTSGKLPIVQITGIGSKGSCEAAAP